MKLDLGGTACYEDDRACSISLDGTSSDDEVTPVIIGDYNYMPYPNETFDEALGSCYLEERPNWDELHRVMKPKSLVYVKSCGELYASLPEVIHEAELAGFTIVDLPVFVTEDDGTRYPDNPLILET